MSNPSAKNLEEIRALFELTIRDSAKFRGNTPLAPMIVNGAFHHYIDSDTDTMWIGFALGFRVAVRGCIEVNAQASRLAASAQEEGR